MKNKTRDLLIQIAEAEGIDAEDFLKIVSDDIDTLNGKYQVWFSDGRWFGERRFVCYKHNKKSALEECDRLQKEHRNNEYFALSPAGHVIS